MRLTTPPIPDIAQGHEEIYERFLKGVLVYRPIPRSEEGRIDLPIAALRNPLEGTFDLSQCGEAGKYLSISTGYRKRKIAENANKLEIWLAPRFWVEKEIEGDAKNLQTIFPAGWSEKDLVAICWTIGSWNSMDCYDYLTWDNFDALDISNWRLHASISILTNPSPHTYDITKYTDTSGEWKSPYARHSRAFAFSFPELK